MASHTCAYFCSDSVIRNQKERQQTVVITVTIVFVMDMVGLNLLISIVESLERVALGSQRSVGT